MKIVLRNDNLYLTLHDHFQIACPLRKKIKRLEAEVEHLTKALAGKLSRPVAGSLPPKS